jgi:predicted O-methyltransferase YrrM
VSHQLKHPTFLPRYLRPTPRVLSLARRWTREALGDRLDAALAVDGWLAEDEAMMLCHLAHECPDGPIVEIGSYKGRSTVFLANGMKDSNTLVAIDPHEYVFKATGTTAWDAFNRTIDDWSLRPVVRVVRDYSHKVRSSWIEPVAMVWIDGDHAYESARRDIDDWAPLDKPGGYVAVHDTHPHYNNNGNVRRAIIESDVLECGGFRTLLELRNAWFMQRQG